MATHFAAWWACPSFISTVLNQSCHQLFIAMGVDTTYKFLQWNFVYPEINYPNSLLSEPKLIVQLVFVPVYVLLEYLHNHHITSYISTSKLRKFQSNEPSLVPRDSDKEVPAYAYSYVRNM